MISRDTPILPIAAGYVCERYGDPMAGRSLPLPVIGIAIATDGKGSWRAVILDHEGRPTFVDGPVKPGGL